MQTHPFHQMDDCTACGRTRAEHPDPLLEALRDIANERGQCSQCGALAMMPSNCVDCDDMKRCTWAPRDPVQVAKAALEAMGKAPDGVKAADSVTSPG